MAKTIKQDQILLSVVEAARAAAFGAAGLTQAACVALLANRHVLDVIAAIQCGYEEMGQEMPQGTASNWKRLAAAGTDYITQVQELGCTLNNRILSDLNVPKVSASGRKAKPAADTATESAAAEPSITPAVWTVDLLKQQWRDQIAKLPKVEGINAAAINAATDGLLAAVAALSVKP